MSSSGATKMKEFYEVSEVGHQLAGPLKEATVAWIEFENDSEIYELIKVDGRTVFRPKSTENADIYFRFSEGSIIKLFDPPSESAEDYVNRLCDCLLEKDRSHNVEVKLLTSIVDGWRKGYISMVKLGGSRALSTIARIGIRIPMKYLIDRKKGAEDDE